MPLEAQLEKLKQIGISPCCDDFVDWICSEWGREAVEADPWNLLLFSLGGEREMGDEWVSLSNDIYCFDTECVEDSNIYQQVFMRLSEISQGELDITEVQSAVDHDNRQAKVSFKFKGSTYNWDLQYNDDWFDCLVFSKINEILKEQGSFKAFYISCPDQNVYIIFGNPEQIEQVNELVAIPFKRP